MKKGRTKSIFAVLMILALMLSMMPAMAGVEETSSVVWDFDDGTTQGFGINGDSPVKTVVAENENGALKLTGLSASSDLSSGNYWANVRLSADGWGKSADIKGMAKLTLDVTSTTPASATFAAIPQSSSNGWTNPARAVRIDPEDFADNGSGAYKATVSITSEDSPNLGLIANHATDNRMTNIILFVGSSVDSLALDNIAFVKEESYSVSIAALTGGSITADPASALAGRTVNLTVTPEPGNRLKDGTLSYTDGTATTTITGTSFIMPAANVTVSAEFEKAPFSHLIGNAAVRKPSEAGALQVLAVDDQKMICGQDGNPVQLRGMSTHGLQWFPAIINDNAFAALSNDWGSNVIRLAVYVTENGYGKDAATATAIMGLIDNGVAYAKNNNMYIIVDWHVLTPGDPNAAEYSGAMQFFETVSSKYPNDPNIIYEIANEPNGNAPGVTNDAAGWAKVKSYAEPIIQMLRDSGNQNIVLVGSPNWSQRPDLAADNPIADSNTVYTVHFYTGTHMPAADSSDRNNVMSNTRYALEHGEAIFASEWGTSEASGNNGPFLDKADEWLEFLNANNVGWCNWSLTNKNETSAAFMPFELNKQDATSLDPGSDQLWEIKELAVSGEYVRARIKGITYEPIDRTPTKDYSTVAWDFNDGTVQGFGVNGDSPVKEANGIAVSNDNDMLKINGLKTAGSTDLSETNYWGNLRLSADNTTDGHRIDILGAQTLTMDIITTEPGEVAIGAIPQSASHGWANPAKTVKAVLNDSSRQSDTTYKATISINTADAPNLGAIGADSADSKMTNLILFVGSSVDAVSIDNITVNGNRTYIEPPVVHDPLGAPALPSDFEDSTRQGWAWAQESGVKTALTISTANGSKALTWEAAYPEVKPSDGWASAPRLVLANINATRGQNKFIDFDLYLAPVRATTGTLSVNLAFAPPSLGYWAQCSNNVNIPLTALAGYEKTSEGLCRIPARFDLDMLNDSKALAPDTLIRDITIVAADVESDFAGRMYIDNVRFSPEDKYTVTAGTTTGGSITADPSLAAAGTEINVTVTPDAGYRYAEGSLEYNDGTAETTITGNSFVMPASNVTVTAQFEKIMYKVKVAPSKFGWITASPVSAGIGDIVTLTVKPFGSFRLKPGSLKYNDGTADVAVSGSSFAMPAANVTISAVFELDVYKVTVTPLKGGKIIASPNIAAPGKRIHLAVIPNKGYRLKAGSLRYNNGTEDIPIKGSSFVLPSSNVTVKAEFELDVYRVNIASLTGGKIVAAPISAAPGKRVYLAVTPDKGCRLKFGSLRYSFGKKNIPIYGNSFIMPASDVTVSAVFEKIPPKGKPHK